MQLASLTVSLIEGLSLFVLVVVGVWAIIAATRKKVLFRVSLQQNVAPVHSSPKYRMEPYPNYGEVFTLAEFQDLMKKYTMDRVASRDVV